LLHLGKLICFEGSIHRFANVADGFAIGAEGHRKEIQVDVTLTFAGIFGSKGTGGHEEAHGHRGFRRRGWWHHLSIE
jgi:hypothetical protein